MNCIKCKRSVNEHPIILVRTAPYGQDGEFMCEDCLKKNEPDLYKNHRNSDEGKVIDSIIGRK